MNRKVCPVFVHCTVSRPACHQTEADVFCYADQAGVGAGGLGEVRGEGTER